MYQLSFAVAPRFRGVTVFVHLLPYLEQDNLARNWDMTDPLTNTAGGPSARTAVKLPVLLCPSDSLPQTSYTDEPSDTSARVETRAGYARMSFITIPCTSVSRTSRPE